MNDDPRMRKREPLAFGSGCEQYCGHRGRLTHTYSHDIRPYESHRVVDREPRRNRAAGAVDVDRDLAIGVLGLQKQQLRNDDISKGLVDLGAEKNYVFLQ